MTDKPRFRPTPRDGQWASTTDSLSNLVSGLGTAADKRSGNQFSFSGLNLFNWVELEAAYTGNWLARQIIQAPVDDGLREWRTFNCEEAPEIAREEKRIGLVNEYKKAQYWARLYGGAIILLITDQPLDQPLDVRKIKKGSLKRLVVLDRWDITGQTINYTNPIEEDYLLPTHYTLYGGGTPIHSSHIIRIEGEELPRRIKALNEGWGDSVLRKVIDDLKDTVATKEGIATLVHEANIDVVNRKGLSEELAAGEESKILRRYSLAAQTKSIVNMLLLDGAEEEQYQRNELSFGGLGDILDKFMIWIAGAAEIPVTRLFGQSAQGLNATGEGDQKNYYDAVASMQESQFRPDLERLDEVLVRSAVGEMPKECEFDWAPLYQESGVELAQQELARAQADDMRLQSGVLKRSHVASRLQAQNDYPLDDAHILELQSQEQAEQEFRPVGEESEEDYLNGA